MKPQKVREPQIVTACNVRQPCRHAWAYDQMPYRSMRTGGPSPTMMVKTHQRLREPRGRRGQTSSPHFSDGRHRPQMPKCRPPRTPAEAIHQITHRSRHRCCPRHTAIPPNSLFPKQMTCQKPMPTCEHPTLPTPVFLFLHKPGRRRPRLPKWTRSCVR